MNGLVSLVKKSTPSSFTYICEKSGTSLSDKVHPSVISENLCCLAFSSSHVSFSSMFRWMSWHALLLECWL